MGPLAVFVHALRHPRHVIHDPPPDLLDLNRSAPCQEPSHVALPIRLEIGPSIGQAAGDPAAVFLAHLPVHVLAQEEMLYTPRETP